MSYHLSSVAIKHARTLKRNKNTVRYTSVAQERRLGPVSNLLTLGLILAALGLLYVTQVTKTSSYSYRVNELNNQKAELVEENRSLSVEAARLQALERIESSSVAKQLPQASDIDYIQ